MSPLALTVAAAVVFVLEGDVVRRQTLVVGEPKGPLLPVESGLEGGETVVLDPDIAWPDGQRVRVAAK